MSKPGRVTADRRAEEGRGRPKKRSEQTDNKSERKRARKPRRVTEEYGKGEGWK